MSAVPSNPRFVLQDTHGNTLHLFAPDAGRRWNGWSVPVLTAAQAAFVSTWVSEPIAAGECDGLVWERAEESGDDPDWQAAIDAGDDFVICHGCNEAVLAWQWAADAETCVPCQEGDRCRSCGDTLTWSDVESQDGLCSACARREEMAERSRGER